MKRHGGLSPRGTPKRRKVEDLESPSPEGRSLRRGGKLPESQDMSLEPSIPPSQGDSEGSLPEWLILGLASLRQKFPEDQFHGTFNSEGAARVVCSDCPGTLYVVDHSNVSKFEPHLRNKKHRENVASRLRRSSIARASIGAPPPTFKGQLRFEKLTRPATPTGNGKTEALTPILPPERKPTPVLPTDITPTQGLSPTIRITALEKANLEKDAKIEALEQRLGWMEEEQKRQAKMLTEALGRKGKNDDGPSQVRDEAGASKNSALIRQGSVADSSVQAAPLKSTFRSVFNMFSSPSN